jgi:DNA-binding transcriptional ArsR family regulator
MKATYPIAAVGELIGELARAAILIALLDGKSRTAGEVALTANVSAQSASAHLSKLVDGGLLTVGRTGRHRYYGMAGPDVAHALEALGSISTLPRCRSWRRVGASRMICTPPAPATTISLAASLSSYRMHSKNPRSSAPAANATTNSAGLVGPGSPISASMLTRCAARVEPSPGSVSIGPSAVLTSQALSARHFVPG